MRLLTYPQRQEMLLYSGESNAGRWRRRSTPTVPCMEGMFDSWHTPGGLARRLDNQSHGLVPREAILFFGRHSKNERLPYYRASNVEFGLGGPFHWARRSAEIEALNETMQEGHHTILKSVVEKKMKARGPGQPWWKTPHPKTITLRSGCEA